MNSKKVVNIILSILIAIALWSYVIYTLEPSQAKLFTNVPVTLLNVDDLNDRGLDVVDKDSVTVDLRVKGKRQVLADMTNDSIHATADVSDCVEGENVVAVNVTFDESAYLENSATITVHVFVDDIVTEEKNVVVQYTGDSGNVSCELVSSNTVEVTGAKSEVADVAYVSAPVAEENLPESEDEIKVDLVPVDSSGSEISGLSLSEDQATVKIYSAGTKKVPLKVDTKGSPADGYAFYGIDGPSTIEIKGSNEDLAKVDEITCEDIDISGLNKNTEVTLSPNLPDGIAIAGSSKITVTVLISGEDESRTVSIKSGDIKIKNLGNGLKAAVSGGAIEVTGKGISADSVTLSVDLSGLTEGSHKVKLDVNAKDGTDVTLSKSSVTVKIVKE